MDKWIGKNVLFRVMAPEHEHNVGEGIVNRLSPNKRCVEIGYGWFLVERVEIIEEIPLPEPIKKVIELPTATTTTRPPETGGGDLNASEAAGMEAKS